MRKIIIHCWLVIMGIMLGSTGASAADVARVHEREALAHTMADLVISTIRDSKKSESARRESLEQGFANVMDIDWIAKFALGNGWRSANDEQRKHYTKLYRQYLTKVYVENYAETSDRKISNIRVLGINDNSSDTYIAHTEVMMVDGHTMKVDYMVRESEGSNQIIDVVIEGVSLLASHRAEFSKLAANQGVDGVIARLEQLVGKPAMQLSMK